MRVELNHFYKWSTKSKTYRFSEQKKEGKKKKKHVFFCISNKTKKHVFFYKIPCRERKDEIFSWKNEWIEKKELEFEEMKIMGKWV
jgi:uncharacterized HAD superfamily protein